MGIIIHRGHFMAKCGFLLQKQGEFVNYAVVRMFSAFRF